MKLPLGLDPYTSLARYTIETYLAEGQMPPLPQDLPEELSAQRAGAFVSLHKGKMLRGCIGTIGPTKPSLAEEIMENALSAALRDPRFPPLTEEELPGLSLKVDILSEPEQVEGLEELDPQRYGVIVTAGYHRGLLLPNIEGVDTVGQQLEIALHKAGIPQKGVPYEVQRFEVSRHSEP